MSKLDDKIVVWQMKLDAGNQDDVSGDLIALLYSSVINCLQFSIGDTRKQIPELPYYSSLEKSASALVLWGADHRVLHGALDRDLQRSFGLQEIVLQILLSIGNAVARYLPKASGDDSRRLWESRTRELASISEAAKYRLYETRDVGVDQASIEIDGQALIETIEVHLTSLRRLNNSLEYPAADNSDDEKRGDESDIKDIPADRYFAALIQARFPRAEAQVVQNLGESNWARYNHIHRQRETARNSSEVTTVAKTLSDFRDSGIGSASSFAYAASVVSTRAEASHKRLPPLPKTARMGQPFICEICERTVTVRRTRDWKEHVFKDICAYTCVFPECPKSGILFEEQSLMASHIESQHGAKSGVLYIICPLCKEDLKGPAGAGSIHLARHMEEIALGVLPNNAEVEDDSETSSSLSRAPYETALAASVLKSAPGYDLWHCYECGADNPFWSPEQCPFCGAPNTNAKSL
ncbi:hypothetical protein HBI88_244650 [Parastagonospora nodorum]|nr:hypothetical protein HBH51_211520 [Parastagonospora nodorum]KAH4015903.1 hypothetical protein HBI09_203350 [Parastagonospora nodorum]KAH4218822.1 hypothetical protein HBI06_194270 [Parastagonospora nodorum]KAH4227773.1 hypothetical protein HBI05_210220 [Parastagonospora nodorum]KAH4980456.1 hypothetical protein HBI77_221560 [Parastagonospora nodorum]